MIDEFLSATWEVLFPLLCNGLAHSSGMALWLSDLSGICAQCSDSGDFWHIIPDLWRTSCWRAQFWLI